MRRRELVPLFFAVLLAAAAPASGWAQQSGSGMWTLFEGTVAATFSFGTTGLITYAVWHLVRQGLSEVVGDRLARFAGVFCCLIVLSAGLRVADRFLTRSGIPLIQAVSNGIVETFSAVIGPTAMSPVEYFTLLGMAVFAAYWLLTRFPGKTAWEELRAKLDALSDRVSFLEK